jgi:hypothetical protein
MMKPSKNRRIFQTIWDEIEYLHDKAAYWLDYRQQRRNAARYLKRLKPLVEKADPRHEAILGAACRAQLAGYAGSLPDEIRFTQHKIKLLEQWLRGHEERQGYDWNDLFDEYELLAALLEEDGKFESARRVKDAARQVRQQSRRVANRTPASRAKAS